MKRRGRKSAAQTPAPQKERVYGSSKNPVGSAASKTSASKIELSDSIVKTLEDKQNDFNDNHPTKKVSLATLKAVMRRGMGAYSTSHRPTITGGAPNSRQAWGFARVNKFLKKYAGQKVKAAYVQDDDLMAKGGVLSMNGEPITFYHGTTDKGYSSYKYIYFTADKDYATQYAESNGRVIEVNIKMNKPFFIEAKYMGQGEIILNDEIIGFYRNLQFDAVEKLKNEGYDGIVVNYPYKNKKYFEVIPFSKNQIIGETFSMGGLFAPNGKSSNLTPEQYKLVRTPEFKAWFGDWENDPANASKVVDENGEPKVVYRGDIGKFNVFEPESHQYGKFWFSDNYYVAKTYGNVREYFLNIRKLYKNISVKVHDRYENVGIILTDVYDPAYDEGDVDLVANNYVAFHSAQIKLADGSNTTFDAQNPDIRYFKGGILDGFSDLQKSIYSTIWSKEKTYIFKFPSDSILILTPTNKKTVKEFQENADKEFFKRIISQKYGEKIADEVVSDIENKRLEIFKITKDTDLEDYKNIMVIDNSTVKLLVENKSFKKNKKLAPNGKPSNLSDKQYELVRTSQFKAWFGDWENDPANASKVVDENGEPLVVYRGDNSESKKGNIFKTGFNRLATTSKDRLPNEYFFYFVDKYHVANGYADDQVDEHNSDIKYYGKKGKFWYPKVSQYFLNIRKPIDLTPNNPLFTSYKEYFKQSVLLFGKDSIDYQRKNLFIPSNYGYQLLSEDFDKILNNELGDYLLIDGKEVDKWEQYRIDELKKYIESNSIRTLIDTWQYFAEYAGRQKRSEILRRMYLKMISLKFDGLIFLENTHYQDVAYEDWNFGNAEKKKLKYDYRDWKHKPKVFATLHSNQIKLADGSNTTFDSDNLDIRYAEGGDLGQEITCVRCGWHWNTADSDESDKYVCHKCGFDNRTFYDSDPIGKYHTKDKNMYKKGGFNKISLPDTESSYDSLQPILAKQGYQLKRIMKPTKTVEEIAEEFDATPQFIQDQLEIGTEHEMEHTYSREVAHDTALHHLAEDPEYYIYLKDMEMRREAQKLDGYYRSGGALSGETTCEVLDKQGERQIDPESIENMTECLNDLPQTKSFHFDYETNDYKPYRKRLHRDIIYEFKKDLVCVERQQPIAILMGGSPASGKSTFLKKYAPYLLKEEIFKVDADEIRSKLPEYRGYNATQTHLETKDIVNTLLSDRNIGIPCRFDVIYDGTMNNTKSYLPLINILKREGYKVFIVYIDRVQKDVIVKRALERYKKSGRFVPLEVIDDFFTKGKEALEQLKQEVDGYMIVDGSNQDYKIIERGGESLPKNRNYSKIGEPIKITTEDVVREFKDGGEIDPDDPKIKSAMTHKAGASGGLLVGNRHSEGGIKAVNKSTGQPLEMEGGEVVITRDAVSDDKKREFEGEMLTNREILSRINQSGGGVSFAEGGDVPHKCACMGKQYKYGGKMMRDNEIVEDIMTTHRKLIGIKYPDLKPSEAMQKLFDYELRYDRGGEIYGHGGTLTFVNKKIPTFDAFSKLNTDVNPQAMKKAYKNFLSKEYHINFHELPHILQASLLMGNQKLVDSYINS